VGGVFNPSDSYFLFAEERGYHRWALAHSLSISSQSILLDFHTKRKNILIVAEKNATKNEHICSMCIKINKVGKQEVGIWWVQKCYPQYGIPIWCLWPNIRFLPSTVAEKNATKNILDGQR
jgi:ribosomal protein L37AE/L43A